MRKISKSVRYDGQRAQIHILENGLEPRWDRRGSCQMRRRGHVKIFSRKMDDMTYKCAWIQA